MPSRSRLLVVVAVAIMLGGCGDDAGPNDGNGAGAQGGAADQDAVELAVTSPDDGMTTRKGAITVKGSVTADSAVTVDGEAAAVRGKSFRRRVALPVGENTVEVKATRHGYKAATEMVVVVRKRRPIATPEPTPVATEEPTQAPTEDDKSADCDPNYEGACLDPNSPDYDCEGGSGNGPDYTGTVRVVGDDPFDLDRDGDGIACE